MTELTLPYPPSANRLWRKSKAGMYLEPKYKAWLLEAATLARRQKPGAVHGKYKLSLVVSRPDNRRRDLDNLLKAVSDVLVAVGVIDDDCFCEKIEAAWSPNGNGVAVRVESAGVE